MGWGCVQEAAVSLFLLFFNNIKNRFDSFHRFDHHISLIPSFSSIPFLHSVFTSFCEDERMLYWITYFLCMYLDNHMALFFSCKIDVSHLWNAKVETSLHARDTQHMVWWDDIILFWTWSASILLRILISMFIKYICLWLSLLYALLFLELRWCSPQRKFREFLPPFLQLLWVVGEELQLVFL